MPKAQQKKKSHKTNKDSQSVNSDRNDSYKLALLVGAIAIAFLVLLVLLRQDDSADIVQDNLTNLSSDEMQLDPHSQPYILIDEDPDYLDQDPLQDLNDLQAPLSNESIDLKLND